MVGWVGSDSKGDSQDVGRGVVRDLSGRVIGTSSGDCDELALLAGLEEEMIDFKALNIAGRAGLMLPYSITVAMTVEEVYELLREREMLKETVKALEEVVAASDDHSEGGGWNRLDPLLRKQRDVLDRVKHMHDLTPEAVEQRHFVDMEADDQLLRDRVEIREDPLDKMMRK